MTNLKLILRTYSALRQMSPDDIALLETLRALNDGDRELMVETLAGKAMGKKAATKTRTYQRCEQCDKTKGHAFHKDSSNDDYHIFQPPAPSSKSSQSSSKSPRASGMATVLKSRRQEQREPMTTKDDNYDPEAERCTFVREDGKLCYLLSDHNIHHMKTYPEYHEFESGKSAAPPAPVPSPANGGVGSTTANSETQPEDVGTVAHGASGGD